MKTKRIKFIENKITKCIYCGGFVNIYLSSIVYNLNNYWEIIMSLPSVKNQNKNIALFDQRINNIKCPLFVKDFKMTKQPLTNCDLNKKRIRYSISNRNSKSFILDSILVCKCTKTIRFEPKTFSKFSFKERIGYNNLLTQIGHFIINYQNRR